MMDKLARELDMDPLELRRKNFIPKEEFPYETPLGIVYDSGDYHGALDKLLENFDLDAFRKEQAELREKGIHRGVGFSTWVEVCGLAPSRAVGPQGVGLQAAFWESAMVRVHPSGSATVYSGASPHGQGLDTSFAQIAADRLGIDPELVDVIHGDTDSGPFGWGTYGSRSLSVGGEAIARAAEKVQEKAKKVCAALLEAAPEDIELADGTFRVKGSPDKSMTMAEISGAAHIPPQELPADIEPGLEETSFYDPENFVFPFGAHACIVDVDMETGKVKVVDYYAVDDCGPAINPMLIEGQIHGGIAHAIGQALYEQVVYDEEGQLVTGTFVDYALPTAAELPSFKTDRTETPSPVNSLGVKGVGEAGTIAATPAVTAAVHGRGQAGQGAGLDGHAAHADAGVGGAARPATAASPRARAGGGAAMITAPFEYRRAGSVDEAISLLGELGEDAKLLAGGHSLLPLMKLRLAAPTTLIDIGGIGGLDTRRGQRRRLPDRRADPPRDAAELARAGRDPAGGGRDRRPAGAQPRHHRRLDRPRRPGVGPAHGHARAGGHVQRDRARRRAPDRGRGVLPGLPDHRARAAGVPDLDRHPVGGLRLGLREVHPPRRGLGHGRRGRAGQGRRRARGVHQHGLHGAAGDRRRGGAQRRPLDADSIAAASEKAADGTEPPGDLNATPEYKAHLARVLTRRALTTAVS